MRGKKTALAVVVLLLIAGQAINSFVSEADYANLDQPTETQVTASPAGAVK